MRIYLNNPVKFHPEPILNDGTVGALGFFEQRCPKRSKNNKMSSERYGITSGSKIYQTYYRV